MNYKLYGYPKVIFDYEKKKIIYNKAFVLKHDNYSWKDVKLNYDADTEQTESKFHPVILDGGKNED